MDDDTEEVNGGLRQKAGEIMLKRYEEAATIINEDVEATVAMMQNDSLCTFLAERAASGRALELASADVKRLVKPARMLAAEVSGWLGLERNRLAEVMGYTNVCVLTHWRDELNAALAPFEGEEKES